jgi:hypothetical protein
MHPFFGAEHDMILNTSLSMLSPSASYGTFLKTFPALHPRAPMTFTTPTAATARSATKVSTPAPAPIMYVLVVSWDDDRRLTGPLSQAPGHLQTQVDTRPHIPTYVESPVISSAHAALAHLADDLRLRRLGSGRVLDRPALQPRRVPVHVPCVQRDLGAPAPTTRGAAGTPRLLPLDVRAGGHEASEAHDQGGLASRVA